MLVKFDEKNGQWQISVGGQHISWWLSSTFIHFIAPTQKMKKKKHLAIESQEMVSAQPFF